MPSTLSRGDLRGLLDVLDVGRSSPSPEGLSTALLGGLCKLLRSDSVTVMELDIARQECIFEQETPDGETLTQAPGVDVFWLHYPGDLHCSYPSRSGDDRSITTVSDFYSTREYRQTAMYCEYVRYFGVEREALVCLASPPGRSRRLLFTRGPGRDFDGRDRMLLALLRPHLGEMYRETQLRRHAVPELTVRQWELLRVAARGHTNPEIARELFISTGTVRKHLENIFARLGVATRTAAVAKAFPDQF